jgi:plasmid maintenance system killer protein
MRGLDGMDWDAMGSEWDELCSITTINDQWSISFRFCYSSGTWEAFACYNHVVSHLSSVRIQPLVDKVSR